MSKPRKLRVLLIHDNPDLGHDALTILRSPHYCMVAPEMGMGRPYLSSWHEIVQSLRAAISGNDHAALECNGKTPLPDLLIIDCNFDEDKQAPSLSIDEIETPENQYDPRGLLYGAVWSAYMAGKAAYHPFTFMLYSQAVDQVEGDGLGLTFFGLLLAISDPNEESSAARNSQGEEVERLRQVLPKYIRRWNTSDVVEMATRQYRDRVLKMSRDDLLSFEPTSVDACLNAVVAFSEGKAAPPRDDLGVVWRIRQKDDCVQLISLAADALTDESTWDQSRCADLIAWLRQIKDDTNWKTEKWKPLISARDGYEGDKPAGIFKSLSTSSAERDGFRVLAITMVWCELWCCRSAGLIPNITAQDVLTPLGMETHQAQRPLRRFLGEALTLRRFLEDVEKSSAWPYANLTWVVPATRSYARELASSLTNVAPWLSKSGLNPASIPPSVFAGDHWPALIK